VLPAVRAYSVSKMADTMKDAGPSGPSLRSEILATMKEGLLLVRRKQL
jgi:hypothetical protein